GIFQNLPVPGLTWFMKGPVFWWTRFNAVGSGVDDKNSHKVAKLIQEDTEQRDRLTEGVYIGESINDPAFRLDQAFKMVKKAEGIEKKIKKAVRAKTLPKKRVNQLIDEALEKNVITKEEYETLSKATEMRNDAIQVDDFSQEQYLGRKG
ncbi:MAG: DUF1974 domain-containing protein, partial [Bdellovibrionales bacterium]|nr:DUF1974 domain-containing protein [Bdellovibrionales bacterium]NQZ20396.1 DUF1974 domain-containing protein [Bdellovibrionales bacterium]